MNTNTLKCACLNCICEIDKVNAIYVDNNYFCTTACATNHADGMGCGCDNSCPCG